MVLSVPAKLQHSYFYSYSSYILALAHHSPYHHTFRDNFCSLSVYYP
jgi:hypothetical protein